MSPSRAFPLLPVVWVACIPTLPGTPVTATPTPEPEPTPAGDDDDDDDDDDSAIVRPDCFSGTLRREQADARYPSATGNPDDPLRELPGTVGRGGDLDDDGYSDAILSQPFPASVLRGGPRTAGGGIPAERLAGSRVPWYLADTGSDLDGNAESDVVTAVSAGALLFLNPLSRTNDGFVDASYSYPAANPEDVGDWEWRACPGEPAPVFGMWGACCGQGGADQVAFAGDHNGDGLPDVLLHYPERTVWYEPDDSRGAPRLWSGTKRTNGVDPDGLLAVITGTEECEWAGAAVAAGDLDGDGQDDIVLAGPGPASIAPEGSWGVGRIYVMKGPITEDTTTAEAVAVIDGTAEGRFNSEGWWIGGVDGDEWTLLPDGYADALGTDLDFGDYNGDGIQDLVAVAPGAWNHGEQVVIFFGPVEGQLSISDADVGFAVPRGVVSVYTYLAGPGDVDGDGFDDLAFVLSAARGDYDYEESVRGVWVFRGPFAPGRYTQDDALVSIGTAFEGAPVGPLGHAGIVGDLDADGADDILITGLAAGSLDLFYGRPACKEL